MRFARYLLGVGIAAGVMLLSVPFALGFTAGFEAVGASVAEEGRETTQSIQRDIDRCEQGVAPSCIHGGMHLRETDSVFADQPRAYAAFQRACSANIQDGCALAGVMLALGRGVAADPQRALLLYESSCAAGSAEGCGALSGALADGSLGPVDEARSVVLGERACKLGDTISCRTRANRQRQGDGMAQNDSAALAGYKNLCVHGDDDSCQEVFLLLHQPALPADMIANLREADHYLGLACSRGLESACADVRRNVARIAEIETTL